MISGKGCHFITTLYHSHSGKQAKTFLQFQSAQSPAYHKPSMQNIRFFDHQQPTFYINKINYHFGKQKPRPIDRKILNAAFIANFILYKIDTFQKEVTYQSIKTSLRQQIVTSLKKLKLEEGQINDQQYVKYLDAYQIGKGVELKELKLQQPHQRFKYQLLDRKFVFNPTSITQKLISDPIKFKSIIVGNTGIGKTLHFRQLKFLSEARIHHYLHQGSSIKDFSSLVCKNLDAFGESYQTKPQVIMKKFIDYPLYIYYETNLKESWKGFFEKMKIQFSYFSFFEKQMKKIKNKSLQDHQYRQLCIKFFKHLNEQLGNIKRKIKNTIVVTVQANEYYEKVGKYYKYFYDAFRNYKLQDFQQKQKLMKQKLLDKKSNIPILEKKLLIAKQKLNLFKQLKVNKQYVLSSKAKLYILSNKKKDGRLILSKIFFKIAKNKTISNKQQLRYGINLTDQVGQIQMYSIFRFQLKQKLFDILLDKIARDKCGEEIQSLNIQAILDKVYNDLIINQSVKSRIIDRFTRNTTQRICSEGLYYNENNELLQQIIKLIAQNYYLKKKPNKQRNNNYLKNFLAIQAKLSTYIVERLTRIAQLSQQKRVQLYYQGHKKAQIVQNAERQTYKRLFWVQLLFDQLDQLQLWEKTWDLIARYAGKVNLIYNYNLTMALSCLKGKLEIGQQIKIDIVNNENEIRQNNFVYNNYAYNNYFLDFNNQDTNFQQSLKILQPQIEQLQANQGIGAFPSVFVDVCWQKIPEYCPNNKAFDVLIVYINDQKKKFYYSIDFTFSTQMDKIFEKIQNAHQLYQKIFKGVENYNHFTVALEEIVQQIHNKEITDDVTHKIREHLISYSQQKIISLNDFRFRPDNRLDDFGRKAIAVQQYLNKFKRANKSQV